MIDAATLADASEVIRARQVFPADGGGPIEDGCVVVSGSRIAAVGAASELPESGRRPVVTEYPEATLLPGLIDAHCHISLAGDGRTYSEMCDDRDELMALVAVHNMHRHLASGVTTLRDNGGRNLVTFAVREAVKRGYFVGPRLLLSGRPITHSLGHFHWCNGEADGVVEIRTAVRRLVAEGADHIKIMACGGGTTGTIPYLASYTPAELHVAVEAAHELDRLTTAHCRAKSAIENALEAGLDCIEHGEFLVRSPYEPSAFGTWSGRMEYDPELGARLVDSGVYLSATLQPSHDELVRLRRRAAAGELSSSQREYLAERERYHEMRLSIFSALVRDGMRPRIALSTDAGPFDVEFGQMAYTIALGVEGGLTPAQALEAATRIAADACGVADKTGTLTPGKEADLLVVEGDPLADVSALRNVRAVYVGGKRVVQDGAVVSLSTARPTP